MVDPPAVLLLAHARDRGVLTAARALGRSGWRVGVGSPVPDGGLVGASRFVDRVHHVPRPRGDLCAVVAAVEAAHEQAGYDVLVGSGDDWLVAASWLADRLPVPVAHPPAQVVDRALDKALLSRLAEDVGLGALRTEPLSTTDESTWPLPVVVKNRHHWRPGMTRQHRVETHVCRTPQELRDRLSRLRSSGDEPVLQTFTEGRLSALVGVVHGGRLLGRVQQSSSRLWPTPTGASSRAVTVPVDAVLAGRAERLLRRLGWSGLVELQFLTGADGIPRLIDLNGRFFGSLALAETARPGLVDAWARSAVGLPVPLLTDGRAGVRYHWLAGDLRRAVAERRRGLLLDVGHSLGYGIGARHSILRLDDPGPAAHLLTGRWPADRLGWTARQPRRRTSRSTSPATRRSGARSTASASW